MAAPSFDLESYLPYLRLYEIFQLNVTHYPEDQPRQGKIPYILKAFKQLKVIEDVLKATEEEEISKGINADGFEAFERAAANLSLHIKKERIWLTEELEHARFEVVKGEGQASFDQYKRQAAKKARLKAEEARLEQEKMLREAAEQARLKQEKKLREAAKQARLVQEKKLKEAAEQARLVQEKRLRVAAAQAKLDQEERTRQANTHQHDVNSGRNQIYHRADVEGPNKLINAVRRQQWQELQDHEAQMVRRGLPPLNDKELKNALALRVENQVKEFLGGKCVVQRVRGGVVKWRTPMRGSTFHNVLEIWLQREETRRQRHFEAMQLKKQKRWEKEMFERSGSINWNPDNAMPRPLPQAYIPPNAKVTANNIRRYDPRQTRAPCRHTASRSKRFHTCVGRKAPTPPGSVYGPSSEPRHRSPSPYTRSASVPRGRQRHRSFSPGFVRTASPAPTSVSRRSNSCFSAGSTAPSIFSRGSSHSSATSVSNAGCSCY